MRSFTISVAVWVIAASVWAKPNVILFLTDDMGWGDAAVFGHPYLVTPNIDRIAAGGTVFKHFYTASPVCSPSRTAFMTGNFPARHGVHSAFGSEEDNRACNMPNYLDPYVNHVSKTMQANGYRTAHFGKWHLSSSPSKTPGIPNPSHYGFDDHATYHTYFPDVPRRNLFIRGGDEHYRAKSTLKIVERTLAFMKDNEGYPCYVNAWTLVPHAPLYPTPEELAVYADLEPKAEDFPEYMRDYLAKLPPDELKTRMQIYCAAMTGLDKALGVLIDGLKEMGQLENTLVLFCSDNGPEDRFGAVRSGTGSPGPLRGRKRSLYRGGVCSPCIAYWPGTVPAGCVDETSVLAAVDWFPTICALTESPMPDYGCDGEDVSDILKGKARSRNTPLFWEWRFGVRGDERYHAPHLAVLDGEWRCHVNHDGTDVQLYNILDDPSEKSDVADQHPELVAGLTRKMMDWRASLPTTVAQSEYARTVAELTEAPAPRAEIALGERIPLTLSGWQACGRANGFAFAEGTPDGFAVTWAESTNNRRDGGGSATFRDGPVTMRIGDEIRFSFDVAVKEHADDVDLALRFGLTNARSGTRGAVIASVDWGQADGRVLRAHFNDNGNRFSAGKSMSGEGAHYLSRSPGTDQVLVAGNTASLSIVYRRISESRYDVTCTWGKETLTIKDFTPGIDLNTFDSAFVLTNVDMPSGAAFDVRNATVTVARATR